MARFDGVWQALEQTGLPICLHCGWSIPDVRRLFNTSYGAHALGCIGGRTVVARARKARPTR